MKKNFLMIVLSALITCFTFYLIRYFHAPNNLEQKDVYTRVYNNKPLYIIFNEENFTINEGEPFDYFDSIKETNGDIDPINSILINYKKGNYIIEYTVRNSKESKNYTKILKVR